MSVRHGRSAGLYIRPVIQKRRALQTLVSVPRFIKEGLAPYRDLFCREAGFEHVSRYVTGLLLSSNKTLQGVYAQQVWPEAQGVSRRAMHAAVFEAGWDSAGLMGRHRAVVSGAHQGRGLEVMSLYWTYLVAPSWRVMASGASGKTVFKSGCTMTAPSN